MNDSMGYPKDPSDRSEAQVIHQLTESSSTLMFKSESSNASPTVVALSEEDARQLIDMLRGDDVGARVAAAHRLDLIAVALGEQRTREVRLFHLGRFTIYTDTFRIIVTYPFFFTKGTSSIPCGWIR
jgi:hypothetical protein